MVALEAAGADQELPGPEPVAGDAPARGPAGDGLGHHVRPAPDIHALPGDTLPLNAVVLPNFEPPARRTAKSGRGLLQMVRRLGWGVADQAVSSVTNFAVSIYVVRSLGAPQFGAFGLAYVTYGFAINVSRGLSTDPLMVRFSGTDATTWRRAVASCAGTAVVIGIILGVCAIGAAALLRGTTGAAFLALGLTLPGLLLQDSWRYSFFALGRGSQAFVNDMIWAVALLPALIVVRDTHHTHRASAFWFILAWGAAGTVGAAAGPLQARVIPRLSGAWRWLYEHRDLGPRYLAEGVSGSAAGLARAYGVGLILGVSAVAYVQASVTVIGPMTILFAGMALVLIPEASRVLRRSPQQLQRFCLLVSAGLSAAGLAWGIALMIVMPMGVGHFVLGGTWRPTYPLILPTTIGLVGTGIGFAAGAGLHALGASRRSLRVALVASAANAVFSVTGAAEWGAVGTIWGTTIAVWIAAVGWWWQLTAAQREWRDTSGANPSMQVRRTGRHRRPDGLDIAD